MNHLASNLKAILLLPFALFIFSMTSCDKDESIITNQTVLFQYNYENFAWISVRNGWFIDNKGEIRGYNQSMDWNQIDSLGYITKDDLLQNYNQANEVLGQIDMDELMDKSKLIEGALDGVLSERDCPGADIGSLALSCYYWDAEKNLYKSQILSLGGDCDQINTSFQAIKLIAFLKQYIQ